MQKHYDAMKTSEHSSLEKYTSHFIERVVCERGMKTEQNYNILTPTLLAITAFLYRSPGLLNLGLGGPVSLGHASHSSTFSPNATELQLLNRWFCWVLVLSTASYLQLTWTSCRRGYIIIWRPLFFLRASQFRTQFNPSTVKVISWYSSTRCTCYLHRCISYFYSLAGSEVNIQQYSLWKFYSSAKMKSVYSALGQTTGPDAKKKQFNFTIKRITIE